MEDVLRRLHRDAAAPKMVTIRTACTAAIEMLENKEVSSKMPACDLREKCLEPLQLALESRAKKLSVHVIAGLQQILKDERFQSNIEVDDEEKWLPVQVLNAVYFTPNLPEEAQVEIMKLLLSMTFSISWCMNAKVITKVAQLYLDCYGASHRSEAGKVSVASFKEMLATFCNPHKQVYIETYSVSSPGVRSAVQAAMTQVLSSFTEKLSEVENQLVKDGDDILADFKAGGNKTTTFESLMEDVVMIIKFLVDKLQVTQSVPQSKIVQPLLLEGIYAVVSNVPLEIQHHDGFKELVWKVLCPTLIALLGTPKMEKSSWHQKTSSEEVGRGSGCSSSAPSILSSTAKIIYSIASELVRLVGSLGSLRPVLESLFHRMLLYPPPQHRLDALKIVKELLGSTERLLDLSGPFVPEKEHKAKKTSLTDLSLIKLIMDSLQECCHCNDSSVCFISIQCVDNLLSSLEKLSRGENLTASVIDAILQFSPQTDIESITESKDTKDEKEVIKEDNNEDDGGTSVTDKPTTETSPEPPLPDTKRDEYGSGPEPEYDDQQEDLSTRRATRITKVCMADVGSQSSSEYGDVINVQETIQSQLAQQQSQELMRRRNLLRDKFEAVERENACLFVDELRSSLPELLAAFSIRDVNEALEQFASNFCAGLVEKCDVTNTDALDVQAAAAVILNADGVYMASISALLLALKLASNGYYTTRDPAKLPFNEKGFMDEILSSGLLLFLSPAWLSEVYQQITSSSILESAGFDPTKYSPLVNMLKDIDGLGSHEIGAQLMSESVDSEVSFNKPADGPAVEAGMKLGRHLLSACWDSVLDVLSVLLNGKSSCGINVSLGLMLGTEGAKEESIKARDAICLSLTGLQSAANLCCNLGLQERCGSAFNQLANTSCVKEDVRSPWPGEAKLHGKTSVLPTKPKLVRLHAVHVLSMDVVMTTGMEMGSHSADCWKHVFRCCAHISELEHTYFSGGNNQSNLPKVQQEQKSDANNLDEIDSGMDMYSASVSVVPVAPRINVAELIRQTSIESGWEGSLLGGGVLNATQASKALCGLSQEVDRLFEEAAEKLNLQGLLTFLAELGESSRLQLRKLRNIESEGVGSWSRLPTNALHLYRLQEVLMKIAHSSRPLLHLIRVWSVVSPYLVEATNSSDRAVTKMSVTCVHDFIVAMLSGHEEKPHFHINEFLCKTFEDMLCMEICDGDVQDQIVCSICELVEACTAQIHSGWRPLFGALRSVKIEYTASEEVNEARQHHVAAVLDVFEVFLDTNNILVFANATVDCILCLLKYVQGPANPNEKLPKADPTGIFEEVSDDESDSGSDVCSPSGEGENLCIPALRYLQRCCSILASMWKMPACPIFKGAHRIQMGSTVKVVDTNIPNMNFEAFSKFFESDDHDEDWVKVTLPDDGVKTDVVFEKCSKYLESKPPSSKQRDYDQGYDDQSVTSVDSGMLDMTSPGSGHQDCISGEPIEPAEVSSLPLTLDKLDNHSGILHVWFLLLDGLATSICSCPKSFQPKTIEMLYELLRSAAEVPGPRFAVYCVNHLLLPMLQSWLRRGARICGYWDSGAINFKQCCGHMSDLVVDFITRFKDMSEEHPYMELMLKQSLDVMIECIAQPVENISRLGCSCIRHVLLSSGPCFTETMWQVSGRALQRALDATTYNLRQLMTLFHLNSDNFYGDIGQVKVATRKGCTIMECLRLRQLAQQVFLLENQVSTMPQVQFDLDEGQSFVFLLYPQNHKDSLNPDHIVTRIPFRNIVIGMLSHQLLLQTVGCLLLDTSEIKPDAESDPNKERKMPGLVQYMSSSNVLLLMSTLQKAYTLACDFDARPGLKFLIQKVAGLEVAANLYKLAGASTVFYVHTLVEICSSLTGLTLERCRSLLSNSSAEAESVDWMTRGKNSQEKISSNQIVFLNLLQSTCMELCQKYVDILLDKDDYARFDTIADHSLFFLIAHSEDSTHKVKPEVENSPSETQPDGFVTTSTVGIQSPEADETSSHVSDPTTEPSVAGDLPSPTHTRSKREMREEEGSKVYTVASDKIIQNLMQEYKRRKQQKSMPAFVKLSKKKKVETQKSGQKENVDQDIDKQQKSSILKDSEAHILSWSEMLRTVLNLFLILDDHQFKALLPTVFSCVNQLICHADSPKLKDTLGQWFHRLGRLYEFCPKDTVAPKQ